MNYSERSNTGDNTPSFSLWFWFLLPVLFVGLSGIFCEGIFRYFHLGEGKVWGITWEKGYYKYIPHGKAGDKSLFDNANYDYPMHIGKHGFRYPEFIDEPKHDIIRIISVGDSTTFGPKILDNNTYAALIAKYLKTLAPSGDFESLNMGMPMSHSGHTLALVKNELVQYKPQFITCYTGVNDSLSFLYSANPASEIYNWLYNHSEFGVWVTKQIKNFIRKERKTGQTLLGKTHNDHIEDAYQKTRSFFFKNILAMYKVCAEYGIRFIMIKQPSRPMEYVDMSQEFLALPFAKKKDVMEDKLSKQNHLTLLEAKFLIQARIMEELPNFCQENDIIMVDFTPIMDHHPDWFLGHVHFNENAHNALAELLAKRIYKEVTSRSIFKASIRDQSE